MMASFWTVACLAGIWCFVICTIGLILKGFPARGVFDRSHCLRWGAAALFCFVVWMIGMANA
jgi:hypothetical protein